MSPFTDLTKTSKFIVNKIFGHFDTFMFSNPITAFFRPLIKDYIIEKTNCNERKEILNRFVLHESINQSMGCRSQYQN